jgi:hypothetical protein
MEKVVRILILTFSSILLVMPNVSFAQTASEEVAIRTYFADLPVMVAIANCESQFHEFNADGSVLHGGYKGHMIGLFQFAPFHQETATLFGWNLNTVAGQLAYARYLYNEEGTVPWNDSSWCWRGAHTAAPSESEIAYAGDVDRATAIQNIQDQVTQIAAVINAMVAAHANS